MDLTKEKSRLVKIISEFKSEIAYDELKDINKLYGKYISVRIEDINRLKSYSRFLKGYLNAKYNKNDKNGRREYKQYKKEVV